MSKEIQRDTGLVLFKTARMFLPVIIYHQWVNWGSHTPTPHVEKRRERRELSSIPVNGISDKEVWEIIQDHKKTTEEYEIMKMAMERKKRIDNNQD